MSKTFDKTRLEALKTDAYENIESYNDPDTPKALEKFTAQIKSILQADPKMLHSVPEYLPVALYGRVKFTPEANLKWAAWLAKNTMPVWDEFKTSVAFNNADLPLVKTIREFNEELLIESCAVLFMLNKHVAAAPGPRDPRDEDDEDTDDSSFGHNADDDYEGQDDEEEGYDDQYDEITFNREGR
ncbi:hypothetical protein [Rheinheimera sp.]|jgi:hypothetical protein|uniref:cold adaptation protein AtcA n=1 Tax=Rheinheimera sp. TaxID=1869214 RepID=UPI002616B491|nr:hypothetical protein [Rheinheimera sp.]MCA1931081.1 hypothetical protein [Rheinheimera sp.]